MFHLFDTYSAGISLLCSALFEAVAVSWFYGLDRFSQDVECMIGSRPGIYWRICWKFISPTFIIGVVMFGLINHEPLRYIDYIYPDWAEWVGWSLALSSILMIPLVAICQLIKTPGTFKEVRRKLKKWNQTNFLSVIEISRFEFVASCLFRLDV